MDRLGLVVEEKLHIIDKSKQQAGELVMQVGLVFLDKLGARKGSNDGFQRLLRFSPGLVAVGERCNGVDSRSALGLRRSWGWKDKGLVVSSAVRGLSKDSECLRYLP